MQAIRASSALRNVAAVKGSTRSAPMTMRSQLASKRFASSVAESANKAKEQAKEQAGKVAETLKGEHHKPSSDVPWMVGSVLVFAPLLVWMSSPPSKKHDDHHHTPVKEKFKPHLRLPPGAEQDPEADDAHRQNEASEEFGGVAGEGRPHSQGDHELRSKQDESSAAQDKQKSPNKDSPVSNHSHDSGLKGDAEKFQAAARGSQIANQSGGGEAARDTKALTQAGRAAAEDKDQDAAYASNTVPESTGEKVGEKLSEQKDARGEEKDVKDSGENKDEQT